MKQVVSISPQQGQFWVRFRAEVREFIIETYQSLEPHSPTARWSDDISADHEGNVELHITLYELDVIATLLKLRFG